MFMKKSILALIVCSAFFVTGCATKTAPVTSTAKSYSPPQLVRDTEADGRIHPNRLAWDRLDTFGPVPPALKQTGDQYCQANNFRRATGYHPQARGVDGNLIPGGGFLCAR